MIESKRLYIRKMNHNDFKEISKMLQDVEVMYAWEHAFSNEEVIEWIDKNIQRYENDGYGYFTKIVETLDYNPNWKYEFEKLKCTLENILGGSILKIEHVGSTSIEGLSAKLRLDVDIVIENYSYLNEAIGKLEN
ncbi:GrpB family protein [Clostridioides sp. ZZV15-6383]|nr:GrpB family protein [Clostridioides sp. ZZV15-6383]